MSIPTDDNLLARLAGCGNAPEGPNPWAALDAKEPEHDAPQQSPAHGDPKLDALLSHIQELTEAGGEKPGPQQTEGASEDAAEADDNPFLPIEPGSFQRAGLTDSEVEALILKFLLARGDATGRDIADQVKLPFRAGRCPVAADEERSTGRSQGRRPDERLSIRDDGFWTGAGTAILAALHVFRFRAGFAGRLHWAVEAQSLTKQHPTEADLRRGVRRPDAQREDARAARAGGEFGPRAFSLRRAGQRQDEHRRAGHRGLRQADLDPAGDRHRRRDHPAFRPGEPPGGAAARRSRGCWISSRSTNDGSASAGRRSLPPAS